MTIREKDTPSATLWILIYRNEKELDRTIASVLEQDFTDAQVIISDDGTPGLDREILEKAADVLRMKFPEVLVNVNEQNLGTVAHINRVIGMAKGDCFVSCCAGDRFVSASSLGSIVRTMKSNGAMATAFRRIDVYSDGNRKARPGIWVGAALLFAPKKFGEKMLRTKNYLSGCCTFTTRKLYEKYGLHDERLRLVEDYPCFVKLLLKGERIGFSPLKVIEHGMGGVSGSSVSPQVLKDIEIMREIMAVR